MQAEKLNYEAELLRLTQEYPNATGEAAELSALLSLHAQAEAEEKNARNQRLLIELRIKAVCKNKGIDPLYFLNETPRPNEPLAEKLKNFRQMQEVLRRRNEELLAAKLSITNAQTADEKETATVAAAEALRKVEEIKKELCQFCFFDEKISGDMEVSPLTKSN